MPRHHHRTLRAAGPDDRRAIETLMASAQWRHAHLDWLDATDLVGQAPFLLVEEGGRPAACLACPPDPPGVSWIRVFAGTSALTPGETWAASWPTASASAARLGARTAAALTAEPWMASLLTGSGFCESNRVVFLEHEGKVRVPALHTGAQLRAYRSTDLRPVVEVDQQAFDGLWRYTEPVLRAALAQAASVTILEVEGEVAGYQLSTASALGAHLARLAVLPEHRGRGYGGALVEHLLHAFVRQGFERVSVNTQQDNVPSLRLYHRLGFRETGPGYPVYTLSLAGPAR